MSIAIRNVAQQRDALLRQLPNIRFASKVWYEAHYNLYSLEARMLSYEAEEAFNKGANTKSVGLLCEANKMLEAAVLEMKNSHAARF